MKMRILGRQAAVFYFIFLALLFLGWSGSVAAYPKYQSAPGAGDYCVECHGSFTSGSYTSNKDGTAWGTDLMDGHEGFVSSCGSCHRGDREEGRVWLNESDLNSRPKSCVGCHGRDEDVNGSCTGVASAIDGIEVECGSGAGLRKHHDRVIDPDPCGQCHQGDVLTPASEDTVPFNYGMNGVDITDPCNADSTESVFGPLGLDNDGDLLDDGADPDCAPPVDTDGDGVDDSVDNCTDIQNADQRDTDSDGIGNACDADITGDCTVNFPDSLAYRSNFFQPGDLDTDNNGDGFTNFVDLAVLNAQFFGPPGPSAAGCN